MAEIAKGERWLNLVSFLLKRRRPADVGEIRRSVAGYRDAGAETVGRRFERDKAGLREAGVPIEYVGEEAPGGPGYVIAREAYFLPPVTLTAAEAAIVSAAGRFALGGAAGPMSESLRSALRKLRFDSAMPGGVRDTGEERVLFHRPKAAQAGAGEGLGELAGAILNRRAVRFAYRAAGSEAGATRAVDPYGLGFSEGHWYLVGRDHGRDAVRVFRTDRIAGAVTRLRPESTRAEFELPKGFRVEGYVGMPPWLFGRTRRLTARIRIDGEVAFMVRMRPAPGDRWEEEAGGGGILTRRATRLDSLAGWVLGLGRHAEALEPPELRDRVREALRMMAAQHAGPGRTEE